MSAFSSPIGGNYQGGHDRRSGARVVPAHPVYVMFGERDGGVIVNLSESGVLIATSLSLVNDYLPRIYIPLNKLGDSIEVAARNVWIDEATHRAAFQLVGLADRDLQKLRAFLWRALEVVPNPPGANHARVPSVLLVPPLPQPPASLVAAQLEPSAEFDRQRALREALAKDPTQFLPRPPKPAKSVPDPAFPPTASEYFAANHLDFPGLPIPGVPQSETPEKETSSNSVQPLRATLPIEYTFPYPPAAIFQERPVSPAPFRGESAKKSESRPPLESTFPYPPKSHFVNAGPDHFAPRPDAILPPPAVVETLVQPVIESVVESVVQPVVENIAELVVPAVVPRQPKAPRRFSFSRKPAVLSTRSVPLPEPAGGVQLEVPQVIPLVTPVVLVEPLVPQSAASQTLVNSVVLSPAELTPAISPGPMPDPNLDYETVAPPAVIHQELFEALPTVPAVSTEELSEAPPTTLVDELPDGFPFVPWQYPSAQPLEENAEETNTIVVEEATLVPTVLDLYSQPLHAPPQAVDQASVAIAASVESTESASSDSLNHPAIGEVASAPEHQAPAPSVPAASTAEPVEETSALGEPAWPSSVVWGAVEPRSTQKTPASAPLPANNEKAGKFSIPLDSPTDEEPIFPPPPTERRISLEMQWIATVGVFTLFAVGAITWYLNSNSYERSSPEYSDGRTSSAPRQTSAVAVSQQAQPPATPEPTVQTAPDSANAAATGTAPNPALPSAPITTQLANSLNSKSPATPPATYPDMTLGDTATIAAQNVSAGQSAHRVIQRALMITIPPPSSPALRLKIPEDTPIHSGTILIQTQRSIYVVPSRIAVDASSQAQILLGELQSPVVPRIPAAGTVSVRATVDEQGRVVEVEPISGPTNVFPAVEAALKSWHYAPTVFQGQMIATQVDITIRSGDVR